MPRIRDEAVCVRHLDWSETSQVVVLFSREHGIIRGLAKGSKRMSPSLIQRFSGGIELFGRGEICGTVRSGGRSSGGFNAEGREMPLATLTEWNLIDDAYALRHNLLAQRRAAVAAEALMALMADGDPYETVFESLVRLVKALPEDRAGRSLLDFLWGLLVETGYRPRLEADPDGPVDSAAMVVSEGASEREIDINADLKAAGEESASPASGASGDSGASRLPNPPSRPTASPTANPAVSPASDPTPPTRSSRRKENLTANERPLIFAPEAGGVIETPDGQLPIERAWRVRPQTIALLRATAAAGETQPRPEGESPQALSDADAEAVQRASRLLSAYLEHLCGREMVTARLVLGSTLPRSSR